MQKKMYKHNTVVRAHDWLNAYLQNQIMWKQLNG